VDFNIYIQSLQNVEAPRALSVTIQNDVENMKQRLLAPRLAKYKAFNGKAMNVSPFLFDIEEEHAQMAVLKENAFEATMGLPFKRGDDDSCEEQWSKSVSEADDASIEEKQSKRMPTGNPSIHLGANDADDHDDGAALLQLTDFLKGPVPQFFRKPIQLKDFLAGPVPEFFLRPQA
jgi:hypothetical protein